jgi:NADH:ubiquinone oxidoreductase subunit 4 (subunit M)
LAKGIHSFIAGAGINHMGFILCGISCNTPLAFSASIFYLLVYILTLLAFFSLLSALKTLHGKFFVTLKDLYSVQDNPFIRTILFIIMFSFAGIPPLAGFFGKSSIFLILLNNDQVLVCGVVIITAIISGYYYLRILSIASFKESGKVVITRFLFIPHNLDLKGLDLPKVARFKKSGRLVITRFKFQNFGIKVLSKFSSLSFNNSIVLLELSLFLVGFMYS